MSPTRDELEERLNESQWDYIEDNDFELVDALYQRMIEEDPETLVELVKEFLNEEGWEEFGQYSDCNFSNCNELIYALNHDEGSELKRDVVTALLDSLSADELEELSEIY